MPEYGFDFEVDAHGADEGRREAVVRVTEEEGCLTDRTVADDQQFEHIIEILIGVLEIRCIIW